MCMSNNTDYLDIYTHKCDYCTCDNLTVRNSGANGPVVNINTEVFGTFMVAGIHKDTEIVSSISEGKLNELEVCMVKAFTQFITKYTGPSVENWVFTTSMKQSSSASR